VTETRYKSKYYIS